MDNDFDSEEGYAEDHPLYVKAKTFREAFLVKDGYDPSDIDDVQFLSCEAGERLIQDFRKYVLSRVDLATGLDMERDSSLWRNVILLN
jgi:hypothetical protein